MAGREVHFLQNKIKIVKLFDKFRERVIYESFITLISKNGRCVMTDETKGAREVVDEIPYDYKVWADLIRNNKALAMNVHVDDMLCVTQAANQSGTQYYVAPDVEEACALRVAHIHRSNAFDRHSEEESPDEIERAERLRVERLFDVSTAVVALAFKGGRGLSPFWEELDALRREEKKEK